MEKYKIDRISDTLNDIVQELGAIHFAADEETRKKLAETFFTMKAPTMFQTLEKHISEGEPGKAVGGKVKHLATHLSLHLTLVLQVIYT